VKSDKLETGRILQFKLEIRKLKLDDMQASSHRIVQFELSNLNCRIRPISSLSDFTILRDRY